MNYGLLELVVSAFISFGVLDCHGITAINGVLRQDGHIIAVNHRGNIRLFLDDTNFDHAFIKHAIKNHIGEKGSYYV